MYNHRGESLYNPDRCTTGTFLVHRNLAIDQEKRAMNETTFCAPA
jgi:hypothetical protein